MGGFKMFLCCNRKTTRSKKCSVCNMDADNATHEGIRTAEKEKVSKLSTNSELRVCVVTWNMNGKVPLQYIAELVSGAEKCDLLIIGLQEVPRGNIAQLFQQVLAETHSLLGESIMQSLQLFVFGLKKYELLLNKEIKIDKYDVGGFGGLLRRKKGAVAIRISVKEIQMVFISCHLSAHAQNVEQRNSQVRNISRSLFSKKRSPYARPSDITVWLGDLNYRIQGDNLPVRNSIENDLHKSLTSKDQLLQEAERGQIFEGYSEGSLRFKPTYKYDTGSSDYDTSHKVRVPSWTDRILFKVENSGEVEATLHSYESLDHIDSSDHKPVKALLSLRLKTSESLVYRL